MSKKIIVFGASNSKNSINKEFAIYAASQLKNVKITILDLNDFDLPIYSIDLEKKSGIPDNAIKFSEYIKESEGLIISLAEHNGLHTSAFKNLWDWMSRINYPNVWYNKPMFLLGTSPSRHEGSHVMKVSKHLFPLFGANIISSFHLPSFNYFFKNRQIIEPKQKERFDIELGKFQNFLTNN